MAYIITRMPSTGSITNVTHSTDPVEEVCERWADVDCVEVVTDKEFLAAARGAREPG